MQKRFLLLLCGALLLVSAPALSAGKIALSPLNPQFIMDQANRSAQIVSYAETSHPLTRFMGKRPSPLNFEHLKKSALRKKLLPHSQYSTSSAELTEVPALYDLRTLGKSSPVRDQGQHGTCWAFAILTAIESALLPTEARDFSEWHLAYWAFMDNPDGFPGFSWRATTDDPTEVFSEGGDDWVALAVLSRGTGPVNEADVPYDEELPSIYPAIAREKLVTGGLYLPYSWETMNETSYPKFNNNVLKRSVMEHSAATLGIGMEFEPLESYNVATSAYYHPGDVLSNHEVVVVGWNDDFPKENFAITPPENGAWIVQNSWGARFGEEGYFYVSYFHTNLDTGFSYLVSSADEYPLIHQHDPLGWARSIQSSEIDPETGWMANVFSVDQDQGLKAVSFYVAAFESQYEITIGTLVDPHAPFTPENRRIILENVSGTIDVPGYHTLPLPNEILLSQGSKFVVQVKLTTPGYDYPLPVEAPIEGYSEKASASTGESYLSSDGLVWSDLADSPSTNTNFCLKALAAPMPLATERVMPDYHTVLTAELASDLGELANYAVNDQHGNLYIHPRKVNQILANSGTGFTGFTLFPIATADVSQSGTLALLQFETSLDAERAGDVRVAKIVDGNTAVELEFADSMQSLADGKFLITSLGGKILKGEELLTENSYHLLVSILDDGVYDLDKIPGKILDPLAIESKHVQATNSSGSVDYFVLVTLLLMGWFVSRLRREKS